MDFISIIQVVAIIGSPLFLGHYVLQGYIHQQQKLAAVPRPAYVSRASFDNLSRQVQLGVIQQEGTFLARRWEDSIKVILYHMPGYFLCELYQQADTHELLQVHTFPDSAPLENYTYNIPIGDLHP